jgi:phenylacetic acid degradation operon negative regulatory protein
MPAPDARRPRLGTASARSLLLTVLGEFVHPRDEDMWTSTWVSAAAALEVEEKAARQALTRVGAEGLLASSRHGRRVRWRLTPSGTDLLTQGTERIYGFMRGRPAWDGRWLVLSLPVPEAQRQLRHRLRTRLTWLGMGTPTPGLWVSPDAGKVDDVRAVVDDLGLGELAVCWTGELSAPDGAASLLARAWDLDEVEVRYHQFLDEVAPVSPGTDLEAFVARVHLVEAWRRFPFVDPDLPPELLDHDWPGHRAADTFHRQHGRWTVAADRAWAAFARG